MFNENKDVCWICDEKIKYEDSCAIGLLKHDVSIGNFDIKMLVHINCFLCETDIKKHEAGLLCIWCDKAVSREDIPAPVIVRFNGNHRWFHQDCWMKNIGVDLEEI